MRLRAMNMAALLATLLGCAADEKPGPNDPQINHVTPDTGVTPDASAPGQGTDAAAPPALVLDAATPGLDASGSADASAQPPLLDASGADASAPPADGSAAQGDASTDAGGDASLPMSGVSCLKGSGNYLMPGPYKFKQKNVTIGQKGMFTIIYPDPLESACPHPFIAWGNGTLITGGTAYRPFQEHAASWGIITVAAHSSSVGDGSFHRAAIDYMLAQNKDSSSEFFGKVSERAGVSGHSQGGAGGDRASTHPNVKANVNVQGSFGTPPMSPAAFLCLTGTEDIQPTGCPMAVRAAKVPAMSASYQGADHVSTTLGGGTGIEQYSRLYSAWFRCFLADDAQACALFKGGASCPVCKDSGWAEIFSANY